MARAGIGLPAPAVDGANEAKEPQNLPMKNGDAPRVRVGIRFLAQICFCHVPIGQSLENPSSHRPPRVPNHSGGVVRPVLSRLGRTAPRFSGKWIFQLCAKVSFIWLSVYSTSAANAVIKRNTD